MYISLNMILYNSIILSYLLHLVRALSVSLYKVSARFGSNGVL